MEASQLDTLSIALPENLKEFVVTRISEGGYRSVSEYVGDLIRADQKHATWAALEGEIIKGLESGPAEPFTDEDWADLRAEVRRRYEARNASC
jgi:antitoxin ParD1/3/4